MKSIAALLILLMIWTVGLAAFAARADRATPAPAPPTADAIVSLTGNSSLRITAAQKLLELGKGRRMLISGVNREASRTDIRDATRGARRIYDCCVDLGFQAENTVGNAREIAAWTEAKGYKSLIVVTADYHMPRAMLEIHAAIPHVKLYPYPVKTEEVDARRWWRTRLGARRMIVEYCKYLAILGREAILSLGPKDAPERDAPEKAEPKPA